MEIADVCLIFEGSYPYVSGGVSHWAHDLMHRQSHLTFHLFCIQPPFQRVEPVYQIPKNVVGMTTIYLQELEKGSSWVARRDKEKLFSALELPMLNLQHLGRLEDLKKILNALQAFPKALGSAVLIDSFEAWQMTLRMYRAMVGDSSFLNFYWSWRGLVSSLYSILLAPMIQARVYHTISTGYAGLYAARAHVETGRSCMVTEHGIYTNERRIEITLADWLYDQKNMDLSMDTAIYERDLKDFWIDSFFGYSKLCYDACDKIITLYQGNQEYQRADGADPAKMCVIPNGVDIERFAALPRDKNHPSPMTPTVALIGRVVPIKDIKSFIHAVAAMHRQIKTLRAFIIGPEAEDPIYSEECHALVKDLQLSEVLTFTGKVQIDAFLPKIDVVVLTSISESQPLVILEAGAAAIPCVTTDAGCCPELIYGRIDEEPPLGPGGAIAPLANPAAIAEHVCRLLQDPPFYEACSKTMQKRIQTYYAAKDAQEAYKKLYAEMMQ